MRAVQAQPWPIRTIPRGTGTTGFAGAPRVPSWLPSCCPWSHGWLGRCGALRQYHWAVRTPPRRSAEDYPPAGPAGVPALDNDLGWALGTVFRRYLKASREAVAD